MNTTSTSTRPFLLAGVAALALLLPACGDDASGAGQLGSGPVSVGSTGGPTPSGSGAPDSPSETPSASSSDSASGSTSAAPRNDVEPVIDADAELDVPDQSGDGSGVQITEVNLSRGSGHVAIFTTAGELLGSAPVSAAARPVTVSLSTPVPASSELLVVLYVDDGDGELDIERDALVLDDDSDVEDEDFDYRLS